MISSIKRAVARSSRAWRADLFRQVLKPDLNASVLDLGGGKGRHMAEFLSTLRNVTIADFNRDALDYAERTYGFRTIQVDGSDRLPFADAEFDIIFCSSVIEHVTGPKDAAVERFKRDGAEFVAVARQHQEQFAKELRRSGKRYFVQTPNRDFPIEVHSWIPFIGALPTHVQWKVIRVFNRFWPRKDEAPDWALLGYEDLRRLFPDATIYRERWMGLTKSFIAIGDDDLGLLRAPVSCALQDHVAFQAVTEIIAPEPDCV